MEQKGADVAGALNMSEDAILKAFNTARELTGQPIANTYREVVQSMTKEELIDFVNKLQRS